MENFPNFNKPASPVEEKPEQEAPIPSELRERLQEVEFKVTETSDQGQSSESSVKGLDAAIDLARQTGATFNYNGSSCSIHFSDGQTSVFITSYDNGCWSRSGRCRNQRQQRRVLVECLS